MWENIPFVILLLVAHQIRLALILLLANITCEVGGSQGAARHVSWEICTPQSWSWGGGWGGGWGEGCGERGGRCCGGGGWFDGGGSRGIPGTIASARAVTRGTRLITTLCHVNQPCDHRGETFSTVGARFWDFLLLLLVVSCFLVSLKQVPASANHLTFVALESSLLPRRRQFGCIDFIQRIKILLRLNLVHDVKEQRRWSS